MGCVAPVPLDRGCSIERIPEACPDHHERQLVRVAAPDIPGIFRPTMHYNCLHNQLQAIRGRVLGVVPKPTFEGVARLKLALKRLVRNFPLVPQVSLDEMPLRYTGGKRTRYQAAVEQVRAYGLRKSDSYCKMFVKAERFDGFAKVNPDPRAIQFRAPRYCVLLASFLQPIEHHIYLSSNCSAGVPATRNIAKGLNSVARAELLIEKGKAFDSPIYIGADASRYDKHISRILLQMEHAVYTHSNPDAQFAYLLTLQLRNKVYSDLGVKYKTDGRRMSGDMNTAVGNCLIMMLMFIATFDVLLHLPKWDSLIDGDDSVIIIERQDLDRVLACIAPSFLEYGMTMKVEDTTSSIFAIEFCQSRIIEYSPGRYKFVRNWKAVISKALCGVRHWNNITYRLRTLAAIGSCELVLGLGVPILQEYALAVLRNVGGSPDLAYAPDGLHARTKRELALLGLRPEYVRPQQIADCARNSFSEAWGVPPAQQLAIEAKLATWTFDPSTTAAWGEEWDVSSWSCYRSSTEICP